MEKTLENRIKRLESDFDELQEILGGIYDALEEDATINKEKNTMKRIVLWIEADEYNNLKNLTSTNEFFIQITPREVSSPDLSVEGKRKKRGE